MRPSADQPHRLTASTERNTRYATKIARPAAKLPCVFVQTAKSPKLSHRHRIRFQLYSAPSSRASGGDFQGRKFQRPSQPAKIHDKLISMPLNIV